jgi:quinol monooxygenase YgiN
MSKVTVVATLTVRADAVEAVQAELFRLIPPTRSEEGCLEYRLHRDREDPTVFTFYENWEDMAALERHLASDHYRRYAAAVSDLLTSKAVRKMAEIG